MFSDVVVAVAVAVVHALTPFFGADAGVRAQRCPWIDSRLHGLI